MKNIETILLEAGLELTDDQKKQVLDGVKENYKTIEDYKKQTEKVDSLNKSLEETQEALKKFDGVDAAGLNQQIKDLEKKIAENEEAYNSKIAERDFDDLIEKAISTAKGKNSKAIKALLDIAALKESKNQKEDLDAALKKLTEAEDSKMLFGETEPEELGTGNPIGTVKPDNNTGLSGVEKAFLERTGVRI